MDFDCLTRKELQFLCKRNKIPANITNVAMADALKALEIVEGLDEFKNQSPEKTMTSTRRKPSKEENQAMQSTIRTRKTARKVPETPVTATNTSRRVLKAELEIKDETPLQSCRGGTGVGSRRKVEAQKEISLQTGYNTRRSVRLLGKSMTGLSLKENEKVEPVKDDEMVEGEVGNNNGQSELPLVRNLSSSLEDEREKNDDVEEERERDNEKNDDEPEGEDKFTDDTDGIVDSKGSDAIAVSEDAHEIENLKPVADETDDVAVSQEGYEIENLKPVAVSQEGYEIKNLKEEMVVDKSTEVLVVNAEASADMEVIDAVSVEENANQARREIECQKSLEEDCEFDAVDDDLTLLPKAEEHADDQVSQNVSVLLDGHMDSSAEKRNEESSDDDDSFLDDSDLDDDMGSDSKSLADAKEEVSSEAPITMVNEEALVGDDEDDTVNEESDKDDDDSFLDDSDLDDDTGSDSKSLADAKEEVSSEAPGTMVNKEALVGDDEDDTGNEESDEDDDAFIDDSDIGNEDPNVTEALVGYDEDDIGNEESDEDDDAFLGDSDIDNEDPNVTEALVDANVTEVGTILVDNGDSEALIDVCVKPAEEFAETAAANSEITTTSISSMSSPLKAQLSQPRKSSSNQVLVNINKENIDNNTVKKELDLGLKKVKKNKNLEDLSLRNLKKLLTEQLSKLEIADKNKEDDTLNKYKTNLANIVAEFYEE